MKFYSVEYWQENWETLMDRVENGETIGVENENGDRAVMTPADEELIRMYTDHSEASWGTVAYWLMRSAYNGVNWVQFSAVLPGGLAIWWMHRTHNSAKVGSIPSSPIDSLDTELSILYNTKVNNQDNDTD